MTFQGPDLREQSCLMLKSLVLCSESSSWVSRIEDFYNLAKFLYKSLSRVICPRYFPGPSRHALQAVGRESGYSLDGILYLFD